jgi:DNA invertase Pin-like site-specific DNA recombinase
MHAALYAHIDPTAPDAQQLEDLRLYVQAYGWTAVEYIDRGEDRPGASMSTNRPQFERLFLDVCAGQFDAIICSDLAQLRAGKTDARALAFFSELLEGLRELDVHFIAIGPEEGLIVDGGPDGTLLRHTLKTMVAPGGMLSSSPRAN